MIRSVRQQAAASGARFLVDAYCGSGLFALSCAPAFERVTGVEVSTTSVQFARENAAANRRLVEQSADLARANQELDFAAKTGALGAISVGLVTAVGYVLLEYFPQYLPKSMRVPGVVDYVFVWGVYFAVFWFRSGISTLLQAKAAGFRTVFFANVVVCVVFYVLFAASLGNVSPPISLATLIVAELLMIYLLNRRLND